MTTLLFIVIWLGALIATCVPVVPATLIIWGAALLHAVLTGFQPITWGLLAGLGALAIAAMLVDNLAAAWGTAKFGGSSAAAWGALAGGLVGLLLGPLGFVIGPFLGAVNSRADLDAQIGARGGEKRPRHAARVAWRDRCEAGDSPDDGRLCAGANLERFNRLPDKCSRLERRRHFSGGFETAPLELAVF